MILLLFSSPFYLTNICYIDSGNYSIDVWKSNLERQARKSTPLNHERNYLLQKVGSVDCLVYVMCFIEQILDAKKLCLPQTDVPHMRLHSAARILMDGISQRGWTSNDEKKS